MKKLFPILFLVVFFSSFVLAYNCEVPGYDYCHEETGTWGDATAYARVYYSLVDEMGRHYGQGEFPGNIAVGRLFADVGFIGDGLYYYENLESWDEVNCDTDGCWPAGDFFDEIAPGEYDLANLHESYSECPVFTAYDYDEAPNGDWVWLSPSLGWLGAGGCFGTNGIRVVECYYDSDCGGGEVCDISGDWQDWHCHTQNTQYSVDSIPQGAEIWYDGVYTWTETPAGVSAPPGSTHVITLIKEGYLDWEETLTWPMEGTEYITATLIPEQECETNADCPTGYECINGECILEEPECYTDADCLAGYECINGECIKEEPIGGVFFVLIGVVVGVVVLIMISRKLRRKKRRK